MTSMARLGRNPLVLVTAASLARDERIARQLAPYGLGVLTGARMRDDPPADPATREAVCALVVGAEAIDSEFASLFPRLDLILRAGSGTDNIQLSDLLRGSITVERLPGVNAEAVADHAFGLMLSVARRITASDAAIRRGDWQPQHGTDLWGKTLGLLGFGPVARAMSRRAKGFDMPLLVYTRTPSPDRFPDVQFVPFKDVVASSDYLSLHLPLTPDTRSIIGAAEFESMPSHGYIVNTARGALIDREALIHALVHRQIAGAALDVFEQEPMRDPMLLSLANVVVTPHQAGYGDTTAAQLPGRVVRALVEHWHLERRSQDATRDD
jgi:D-3-phosphoglycerate dehydrogenase